MGGTLVGRGISVSISEIFKQGLPTRAKGMNKSKAGTAPLLLICHKRCTGVSASEQVLASDGNDDASLR